MFKLITFGRLWFGRVDIIIINPLMRKIMFIPNLFLPQTITSVATMLTVVLIE